MERKEHHLRLRRKILRPADRPLADKYTSLTQNNNRDLDSVFLINEDGEKIKPEIVNRRCIRLTKNGRLLQPAVKWIFQADYFAK